MTIKGIVFDFDGLILDTETPEYQALQELYHSYGKTLPLEKWAQSLGASYDAFDPIAYLSSLVDQPMDKVKAFKGYKKRSLEILGQEPPLPGVLDTIRAAQQKGLRLAVASSSPYEWVKGHLSRLGLDECFEYILTANDVTNVKPDPELYLAAIRRLDLAPSEAIAFEDSPNGIKAARAAGLYCVAVLNPLTRQLDTDHANLVIDSLADVCLDSLIELAEAS